MRFVRRAAGLLALAAAVGCGGGGPQMAEVEGVITSGGKPLDKIQVEFWPEASGPRSYGKTDANGRYTLTTDDGSKTGAVVGQHRIVLRDLTQYGDKIVGRGGENKDLSGGKKNRIPGPYSDTEKTPARKAVAAGTKNKIDVEVKP